MPRPSALLVVREVVSPDTIAHPFRRPCSVCLSVTQRTVKATLAVSVTVPLHTVALAAGSVSPAGRVWSAGCGPPRARGPHTPRFIRSNRLTAVGYDAVLATRQALGEPYVLHSR